MGSERGDTLSTTNNTRNMNKQELIQGMREILKEERMEQAKPRFEALTVPKPSEYDGVMCPCCNYEHTMEAGTPEVNDEELFRYTKCTRCKATWTEVYGIIGYANLKDEEGEDIEIPDDGLFGPRELMEERDLLKDYVRMAATGNTDVTDLEEQAKKLLDKLNTAAR